MIENNIIFGPTYKRKIFVSMGELFYETLKKHNDNILQIDCVTNEEQSAILLLNKSICLAKWLKSNGIGVGKFVAISSENRLEYLVILVATFMSGATFTAFNPDYTKAELEHYFRLTEPSVVFFSEKSMSAIYNFAITQPYVKHAVLIGGNETSTIDKPIILENILKGANESWNFDETFFPEKVDPEKTIAAVIYSSGTTGLPKGVMLSHYNLTSFIEITSNIVMFDTSSKKEYRLVVTPYFHGMGLLGVIRFCLAGICNLIIPRFQPKLFMDTLTKYKISQIATPPTLWHFLLKHPIVDNYDLKDLKILMGGGAPISSELENAIKNKFPSIEMVLQGYGMSETVAGIAFPPGKAHKKGSIGKIYPGFKAKVVSDSGAILGPNQIGELCFSSPTVMMGYVKNPKATKEAFDSDGYLLSGDIGYYDEDEYFFVVDRKKELIKYKAFQIAPVELESLLIKHPEIQEAAVVGLPDEYSGELPAAFVVKVAGSKVTAKEIENYIAGIVSNVKKLRGGVYFVDKIPTTPSGKVMRRILKENALKLQSKL